MSCWVISLTSNVNVQYVYHSSGLMMSCMGLIAGWFDGCKLHCNRSNRLLITENRVWLQVRSHSLHEELWCRVRFRELIVLALKNKSPEKHSDLNCTFFRVVVVEFPTISNPSITPKHQLGHFNRTDDLISAVTSTHVMKSCSSLKTRLWSECLSSFLRVSSLNYLQFSECFFKAKISTQRCFKI